MSFRSLRFAASACLILAVAACGKPDEPTDAAAPSNLAVTLVPAQLHALPRSVVVSGPVSPWEEMQLGVEISGARIE